MDTEPQNVAETLGQINKAWLSGRPRDMEPLIHPEIVLVLPGFEGRVTGRPALLAGFEEFCRTCRMISFEEGHHEVDRVGDTAVASFRFDMVYERDGGRTRATGHDLWVFSRTTGGWQAVWRTLLDLHEVPA